MKKVVKFGGSSLASAEQFQKVKQIIDGDSARRYIVPSAPGKRSDKDEKVTDLFYQCYDLIIKEKPYHEVFFRIRQRYEEIIRDLHLDLSLEEEFLEIEHRFLEKVGRNYAASRGEYLNGLVMANYLKYPFLDAAKVILFGEDGLFDAEKTNEVLSHALKDMETAVIPGFYGAKADGSIQTFSRGGSDITGSVVARAVHADLYENWTDVSGFLVADPRVVNCPQVIETITYRELRELAYMGACVLHEDSIFPVRKEGIPINIKNTNRPEDPGTLIVESTCRKPKYAITGIAGKKGFCAIHIEKAMMNTEVGFGRKVLEVFETYKVPFEHIPSGIDTMTVFVHQSEFENFEQSVIAGIHRAVTPDSVELEADFSLIAVVGRGMRATRGTAGRIFSAIASAGINIRMIDQGPSELNIIIGVRNEDFNPAIQAIYDVFVDENSSEAI